MKATREDRERAVAYAYPMGAPDYAKKWAETGDDYRHEYIAHATPLGLAELVAASRAAGAAEERARVLELVQEFRADAAEEGHSTAFHVLGLLLKRIEAP